MSAIPSGACPYCGEPMSHGSEACRAALIRQRNLAEETLTRVETERIELTRRVQELEDTVRDLLGKPVLR